MAARINLDSEIWDDPRFTALQGKIGRRSAIGCVVELWTLGQSYWRKNEGRIPEELFRRMESWEALLECDFARKEEGGIYCSGAKERWGFLLARSEAGRVGGLRSAQVRSEKYGSAIPFGAPNAEANAEAKPSKPKPSSSSSSSLSSSSLLVKKSPIPRARKIALSAVGDWENLSPEKIALWGKSFPGVDVKSEVAKAAAWAVANPKNKKSNWERFLVNWLTRSQDRARPSPVTAINAPRRPAPVKVDPAWGAAWEEKYGAAK